VRFLIDEMFSPAVGMNLETIGHDVYSVAAVSPRLSDEEVVTIATREQRVVVTENSRDFAYITTCPVLLVLKDWWPKGSLTLRMSNALGKWAAANPEPGNWARWLDAEYR
jgi:hypothetical protein